MKQPYVIMVWMMLLLSSVSSWAYDVVSESDTLRTDSISEPEWYVAPVSYDSVMKHRYNAPRRVTAAASCPTDSVLTFDIDSNLVSVTVYEYGDTTCTITWSVSADGSRIGQSKEESATTSTQSFTAKYTWDEITNDWKGTSKSEFVYSAGLMTTNTAFLWLNNAWIPNTRYTYAYDASNRETEYISYTCDETTNNLVPSKSRVQEWYDDTNKTLEILYTAHDGTSWSAGTMKVWDYDANANQTLYEYYSSYSNGAWLSSTKEQWAFNASNQQTLHEKYSYSDGDWTITLQENSGYDEVGNNTWIENYSLTNNVWKGSRKEEYTYSDTIKTATFFYTWNADSNAFIYRLWSINDTTVTPTEKCSYKWQNNQWVGTGTRTLTTKTDGRETQKITQTWSSTASDWVNKNCTTSVYTGADKTHETIYKWQNDAWAMTSITRADISDVTVDGIRQIVYTQWRCGADSVWAGVQKDSSAYSPMGKKLFELKYNAWANNEWVPYYKIEYQYDELNREVMNSRMDWVNNKWKGHYLFEYGYDDQDRQTAYTYYGDWNSTTDSWIGSSKQDCAYASNGKYGQKTMYKWDYDQNQWTGLFQYFYTYDASNHEIEQVVQGYSDNEWINSQLYIHEYDGSLLLKNNEYRWVNDDWMMITRNESYYDDATPANLHQTIVGSWSSSTGDVNSYTDKHYFYTCAPKYYTIRFVNYDGTILETQTLEKGFTPVYSGAEPAKEADAQYTYTFSGWTPTIAEVTGDATYTATFTATKNKYLVTFKDEDGTILQSEEVEYGVTPTAPANPTKAATAEWTYTFAGWDKEIISVAEATTYTATYTATKNSYTVTWKNEDGSVIASETLEYGTTPAHADINKESTAEYTYTFTGWTPQITAVTGDAVYTATFDSTVNQYTVTFYWENGTTILRQMQLSYGELPTISVIPARNADNQCSYYSFAGWEPEIAPVTGNASYIPTYTEHYYEYMVTFRNYNRQDLQYSMQPCGFIPTYDGATPTKPGNEQYSYVFMGWTPELTELTGDAVYTATYERTVNTYTIVFLDENGTELDRTEVAYGQMPSTSVVPTKEDDEEYTYTFAGWSPQLKRVTGDATYRATYKATAKTEGFNNAEVGETATKVIIDNQIFIRRGGNIYTIDGHLVE